MTEVNNSEDVIDSRDVIARIETLEGQVEEDGSGLDEEETTELASLKALAEEASGYAADWQYGEVLIRDSYFLSYAQELADDCGCIQKDVAWPLTCIDWEQAARELKYDYTEVDFDGVSYWIR